VADDPIASTAGGEEPRPVASARQVLKAFHNHMTLARFQPKEEHADPYGRPMVLRSPLVSPEDLEEGITAADDAAAWAKRQRGGSLFGWIARRVRRRRERSGVS